jgi:hypothetical protein
MNETLQPDDVTRLRTKLLRTEGLAVLFAVLAFAGMGLVRWYTKAQLAKAIDCAPGACRDTFMKHYYGDVACPRDDQRIEAIGTGTDGFFCRCRRN